MELRIRSDQEVLLVEVIGPLDDDAQALFNDELHPAAAEEGTRIVIDLALAPRVTSNGIGALVSLVAWATAHKARVVLCCPTAFVRSVFQTTRLDTYLEIADSREAARRVFLEPRVE